MTTVSSGVKTTLTYYGYYVGTFPTSALKVGNKRRSVENQYESLFSGVTESTHLMKQKKQAPFLLKGRCNRALVLTPTVLTSAG